MRGEHWFSRNRAGQGFALGAEGVGIVVEKGEGCIDDDKDPRMLPLGAKVAFVGGAFAEAVIVPEKMCYKINRYLHD